MALTSTLMKAIACQFCGTATDVPHETQEACIAALQQEIAWMRDILEHSTPAGAMPHTESPDSASENDEQR
jgi:hypothetical protein